MKQTILLAALGATAFGAAAQEFGNVLSSTPVIQQVAVPRTVCQPVQPAQVTTTGGGAVVGGLTGAGIGSMIGHGSGNTAAIAVGTIMGAIVGNNVEAQNQRYAQTYPQCVTQNVAENRTVGYDVVYEYRGQQYSARMPYDPGRTLQLQVAQAAPVAPVAPQAPIAQSVDPSSVVVAPPVHGGQAIVATTPAPMVQQAAPAPVVVQAAPAPVVVQAPAPVVYQPYATYPAYPAYGYGYGYGYPYPYYRGYAPVGVSLGFVFSNGHRHGGHHHHHGGGRRHR